MPYLDLVSDIIQRVADHAGTLPPAVLRKIEAEAREEWGGHTHYIPKLGEAARLDLVERDRRICQASKDGVPHDYLSAKYNLSIRRIQQIVSTRNDLP